MSSDVQAKCPKCKTPVSVAESDSAQSVTCSSCQSTFVPAEVIAASDKQFEIAMYVGMLVIGIGLLVYMAMTGQLKPNADEPGPPAAVEPAAVDQ